ncbi:MAG: acetyl-CoA carboxylase biotin carboxyl carrier protein [Pirellulales bacterium]
MASNAGSGSGDVFDVRRVRRFIELMNEHDLSEIDLRQADQRIRLRRGPEMVTVAGAVAPAAVAAAPAASAAKAPAESGPAAPAAADDANAQFIRSPMVGTFYASGSPDAAPFVKVGDQIGPETTVCIVEAMKVFNEIPAECSGKIAAVLATNGQSVEYNQPLFRVSPNA